MLKSVVAAACTAATVLTVTGVAQAQELNAIPDVVRTLDGSGNNVRNPTWGQTNTPYLRVAPANYADGIKKPVSGPPTRYVSNRVFNDTNQNLFSENGVTQWGFTWGQFMDHTFGLRQEVGGESAPIAFSAADPLESFTNTFGAIDFTRTPAAPGTGVTTPRQQINTVSSYIDAFSVYGGTNARLEWLREGPVDGNLANNGARLLLAPDGTLPRRTARGNAATAPEMALQGRLMGNAGKAMVAGDVRANENIALSATHTLFAKEHNRIVNALPRTLGEEARFQIARRVVGAEQQFITYTEFLPSLGLGLSPYRGYNPNVNASLGNEFAVVGYRAHSMIHGELEPSVPEGFYTDAQLEAFEDQGIEVEHEDGAVVLVIPLNLAFGNPDLLQAIGVAPILKGVGSESEYKNDEQIDNQLRSVLFQVPKPGIPDPSVCLDGPPLPDCFQGVVDLGAIDIERGRDHGMPLYNNLRKAYGLPAKTSFTAITGEATDRFPTNDPLVSRTNPIDDPNSLDFVELRDIDGNVIPFGTEEADGAAVVGKRRTTLAARLRALYGTPDKLDAFVGMVAERHVGGSEFGELQRAIWRKQFEALRDGDRFFYLNDPALPTIRAVFGIDYRKTLGQVIEQNTGLDVQDDVFKVVPEE
jgi:peroxidase